MSLGDPCSSCGRVPEEFEYRKEENLTKIESSADDNVGGTLYLIGRCECSEWVKEGDDWLWLQEICHPSIHIN